MMRSMTPKALVCGAALIALFAGCGEEDTAQAWQVRETPGDQTGYGDADVVVISPGGTGGSVTYEVSGDGEGCARIDADTCVDINAERGRYCGGEGAQADIILNEAGEVVEVICYPAPDAGTQIEEVTVTDGGDVTLPQNANGAVIVFAEETDGEPIEGNVELKAERAVVFGNGVDKTIFAGNLKISSNNARVRGVTIQGNLEVGSNNSAVSFCKVLGNAQVEGNGFTLANCQIFGNVDIKGNGATLLNVGVAGEWKPGSAACDGCYSFTDEDDDKLVQEDEVGDPLTCSGAL